MASILVRKLDDDVKRKLQKRAKEHGRTTEAEVREILSAAVASDPDDEYGLGSKIVALFAGTGGMPEIKRVRSKPRPAQFRR